VDRVWYRSYEEGVPPTLSYPDKTLNDLLQDSTRAHPRRIAPNYVVGRQLMPLFGAGVGALIGRVAGRKVDIGLPDDFVKQVSAQLKPESSALMLMVNSLNRQVVVPQLQAALDEQAGNAAPAEN